MIYYERKKNKIPIVIYFFISIIWCNFLLNIIVVLLFNFKSGVYVEYNYFFKLLMLSFVFFIFVFARYYSEGITTLTIDENKREIVMECHFVYTLFFRKKTKTISLDNFSFSYEQRRGFLTKVLHYMLPTWTKAFIFFPNKSFAGIGFADYLGWKPDQLDEIYHKLLEYGDAEHKLHLKEQKQRWNYSCETYETVENL